MTTPDEQLNLPAHVACIMDGNGRWASAQGLSRAKGHRAGADTVGAICEACADLGIPWLTLYAFSSENWNRPESEINDLMKLLHSFLKEKTKEMIEQKVRLHAIGDLSRLPEKTRKLLSETIKKTSANDKLNVVLALSYGSRQEITDATRKIAQQVARGELSPDDITEETISRNLYTAGMPDPDLLIRTSGECRISNFLLWQISYTEIVVTPKFWPEFTKEDFAEAVREYGTRQRRFGNI